jgi:hypothetical protein
MVAEGLVTHRTCSYEETMRLLALTVLICVLGGCAADPEWAWRRADGQSARNDPALLKQFQDDRSACLGETRQAGLVGAAGERGLPSGTIRSMRGQLAEEVVRECMARKGYVPIRKEADGSAGPKPGM